MRSNCVCEEFGGREGSQLTDNACNYLIVINPHHCAYQNVSGRHSLVSCLVMFFCVNCIPSERPLRGTSQ